MKSKFSATPPYPIIGIIEKIFLLKKMTISIIKDKFIFYICITIKDIFVLY
jgi:hypothetical protein